MKNILAENMRRFGTKNLAEQETGDTPQPAAEKDAPHFEDGLEQTAITAWLMRYVAEHRFKASQNNYTFKSWVKFGPGTSVVLTTTPEGNMLRVEIYTGVGRKNAAFEKTYKLADWQTGTPGAIEGVIMPYIK